MRFSGAYAGGSIQVRSPSQMLLSDHEIEKTIPLLQLFSRRIWVRHSTPNNPQGLGRWTSFDVNWVRHWVRRWKQDSKSFAAAGSEVFQSLTEFKQIIGRGTRLRPDYGKNFFTIIDFRGASQLFDDPDWDGTPIQDEDFGTGKKPTDPKLGGIEGTDAGADDSTEERFKYQVSRQEFVVAKERVSYYDKDGKLTTESLKDYTRRTVNEAYQSLDRFLNQWHTTDRKQVILEELQAHGVILEALENMVGKDYDLFDLICHVAFDRPPLTRKERVEHVRKRDVFAKYGETARVVLAALLEKYADQGVVSIENSTVLQLDPFNQLGTPVELIRSFGGKKQYQAAIQELKRLLYEDQGA